MLVETWLRFVVRYRWAVLAATLARDRRGRCAGPRAAQGHVRERVYRARQSGAAVSRARRRHVRAQGTDRHRRSQPRARRDPDAAEALRQRASHRPAARSAAQHRPRSHHEPSEPQRHQRRRRRDRSGAAAAGGRDRCRDGQPCARCDRCLADLRRHAGIEGPHCHDHRCGAARRETQRARRIRRSSISVASCPRCPASRSSSPAPARSPATSRLTSIATPAGWCRSPPSR